MFSAPLYVYGKDFWWQQKNAEAELVIPGRTIMFRPGFETEASRVNKAMAACLAGFHPQVGDEAIVKGLGMPGLPGRFEVHPGETIFVLDVAHTPESIDNFLEGVSRRYPCARIAFAAGFLADKPAEIMLKKMQTLGRVYYAPIKDSRGFDAATISVPDAVRAESISAAMTLAAEQADVVCVTGSFAAVREARILLSNRK
jgi:folylpolyglutamate synthase/dihydropteroate synthase